MARSSRPSLPQSSSVLDDVRELHHRVAERIRELEPYAAELQELRSAADRLDFDPITSPQGRRARAGADGRAARSKRAAGKPTTVSMSRRRRKRAGESRADQVARLVQERPGITVAALAEALEVSGTGLYRVVRQLEAEGRLQKDGRQLQPTADGVRRVEEEAVPPQPT